MQKTLKSFIKNYSMDKQVVNDVLWNLEYVYNSVKIYGKDDTFNIPFYVNKLKYAIEQMESQIK